MATIDTSDIKNFTVTPAKDGLTADKLFGSGYTFTDDDTNKYTLHMHTLQKMI